MVRPYEEQLKHWAAKKYNLPIDTIKSVSLEIDAYMGGCCETCEYSTADIEITIDRTSGKSVTKTENKYDLGSIIREILEA